MKRTLKGLLAVSVALALSLSTLTACGDGEQQKEPSGETPGSTPGEELPPENQEPSWTTADYEAFVAKMGTAGNYTYTVTEQDTTVIYQIVGDAVSFRATGDSNKVYWYVEAEAFYQLKFEDDQYYHKTRIESFDTDDYIYNDMKGATITDFDEETEIYTVTMGGATYSMQVSSKMMQFASAEKSMSVKYIGETAIDFPNPISIKDDTAKEPEDPNPPKVDPEEPPVEEEKIYTADAQGNRTYNSKLLGETFKEILNTETEDGVVLYKKLTSNYGVSVDEILFVVTEGGYMQVGALTTIGINKVLNVIRIDQSRVNELSADKQAWVDAFSTGDGIDTNDLVSISYAVSMEPSHHEELMQIAKKAMDKVAEEGVRSDGLNTVGTPEPRYANSEVLEVFEGPDLLDGQSGFGLGYAHCKLIFAIIKDGNGTPMAIEMNLATTSYKSFEETVLNEDINNVFVVYKMKRAQELDAQFFEDTGTASAVRVQALPPRKF